MSASNYRDSYLTTANTAFVAARASTYIEDTAATQRSVVSSSNSDDGSPTGTGAHIVRITYYDNNLNGPFTEDVTLNGTAAVNTVASDIRFIEQLEVIQVGSNGANVGTISLRQNTGGGGSTLASINAGENITFFAHHYIPDGKYSVIRLLYVGALGNSGRLVGRSTNPLAANQVEKQIGPQLRVQASAPSLIADLSQPLVVTGPAKYTMYFRSDSNTANTIFCGFGFEDRT